MSVKINTGSVPLKIGIEDTFTFKDNISKNDIVKTLFTYPSTTISDPTTIPDNTAYEVAWSPDNTYLAVASSGTNDFHIYKNTSNTLTRLANPSTMPNGTCRSVKFSSDGVYLFVTSISPPYLMVYKRSGDTFTYLSTAFDVQPVGQTYSVDINYDMTYVVATHATTPFITIYKRSGDTFTKLANPATLPTGACYTSSFTKDASRLAIGGVVTPFLMVYERSGDTFTQIYTETNGSNHNCVKFSKSGKYLLAACSNSPYAKVRVDTNDGSYSTSLISFSSAISVTVNSCDVDEDEVFFIFGNTSMNFYKRKGYVLNRISTNIPVFSGVKNSIDFSNDSTLIAMCGDTTPYLRAWYGGKREAYLGDGYLGYDWVGYAIEDGNINEQKKVKITHKY